MTDPLLSTARLRLLPWAPSDVDALHALFQLAPVRRYLWDDLLIAREDVEAVQIQSERSFRSHGFGQWVLLSDDAPGLLGFAGLRHVDDTPEVELLYALAPDHWGAGLACEASRAVLRHGFEKCGLERIAGRVDTPNSASIRVLERLGMRFEGERLVDGRPTVHYGLAAADFPCDEPTR